MKQGKLLGIIIIVLIIIGYIFISPTNKKNEKNQIKVGVILPLTGDAAIYGKAMKNGIELALEESTNREIYTMMYEDDKGEQNEANSAVTLLISKRIDVLIGGAQSKTANVLISQIEKNKIPMIAPGASSTDFNKSTNYFMRVWPSDSYDGEILGNYVAGQTNINTDIAVFYTGSKYGEGIKQVFEKIIKENGNEIVFSERFIEGSRDFRTQIQKIKESGAEVLFLPGYFTEVSIIVKQIIELGLNDIQIYGTSSFHDQKLIDELGEALNDIIFSFPDFDINGKNANTKEFGDNYFKSFNIKADIFSAYAYDCFKLIDYAVSLGARTREEIHDKVLNVENFEGAGGNFSFDKFGNVIKTFSIYQISNGDFLKLK